MERFIFVILIVQSTGWIQGSLFTKSPQPTLWRERFLFLTYGSDRPRGNDRGRGRRQVVGGLGAGATQADELAGLGQTCANQEETFSKSVRFGGVQEVDVFEVEVKNFDI